MWGVMTEGSNEGMRSDSTYVAHVELKALRKDRTARSISPDSSPPKLTSSSQRPPDVLPRLVTHDDPLHTIRRHCHPSTKRCRRRARKCTPTSRRSNGCARSSRRSGSTMRTCGSHSRASRRFHPSAAVYAVWRRCSSSSSTATTMRLGRTCLATARSRPLQGRAHQGRRDRERREGRRCAIG
jgi:hypothetical protein